MIQFSLTLSGPQLAILRDLREGVSIGGSLKHSRYFLVSCRKLEQEGLMKWGKWDMGREIEPYSITIKGALALQIAEIDVAEFQSSLRPQEKHGRVAS